MSEGVTITRLSKAAREFNIGMKTVVDFLTKKGFPIEMDPNAKLTQDMYNFLMKEFASEKHVKEEAKKIGLQFTSHETITIEDKKTATKDREKELDDLFIKNVSMDFEKKQYDSVKKSKEVVVKEHVIEPVAEVKVEEVISLPEPLPEEPPSIQPEKIAEPEVPAEQPPAAHPVVIEPEPVEIYDQAPEPKDIEVSLPVIEEPAEETPASSEPEPDKKSANDLKIVGKMDLGIFAKKPVKKGQGKVKKVEETVISTPVEEPVSVEDIAVAGPEIV